jgi:hypothetical protein
MQWCAEAASAPRSVIRAWSASASTSLSPSGSPARGPCLSRGIPRAVRIGWRLCRECEGTQPSLGGLGRDGTHATPRCWSTTLHGCRHRRRPWRRRRTARAGFVSAPSPTAPDPLAAVPRRPQPSPPPPPPQPWRRVRSHCRFRNRGTEYVSEPGMKRINGRTKRPRHCFSARLVCTRRV